MAKKKIVIKVGFPKEKQIIYPPKVRDVIDAKGNHKMIFKNGGQTVAEVATWNEKGTKHIPSRPFFSTAINENKDKIKEMVAEAIRNKHDKTLYDKIGISIVNMVKDSIVNGNWVPNSERTKIEALPPSLRKAWDAGKKDSAMYQKAKEAIENKKPLIDRGIMLKSVSYVISEE